MEKSTVKKIRIIVLIFALIFAITCIILAGIHFQQTNMRWTKHGYGALGALELASILLAFVVIFLGFAAFLLQSKGILIILIILSFLSALFVLAIVIFCFIGTKTRYWDHYTGCNADYDGYLSVFNSVDNYLYAVDSLLCSDKCPCYFNETTAMLYVSNSSTAAYFNQWQKQNITLRARKFQDCDDVTKSAAKVDYIATNAYYNHTFNDKKFQKYYKHIEEKFHCTGFCGTTYFNKRINANSKIVKYLFSDLTRGIPEHFGCLSSMMDWLRKTMNAFAACGVFLFVILLVLMVLAIMMLVEIPNNEKQNKEESKIRERSEDEKEKKEEENKQLENQSLNTEEVNLLFDKIEENRESKDKQKNENEGDGIERVYIQNSSYVIPESQLKEEEIKFNPSISKS